MHFSIFMKIPAPLFSKTRAAVLTLSLGLFAACSEPGTNGSGSSDSAAKASTPTAKAVAVDPGLTLPVLDALFYEPEFTTDLKTKLGLTDDQIAKLKAAAQKSVSDLDEAGEGAYLGSARAESKRSEEQLRAIIGEDKVAQLRQFVAQRYADGDLDGLLPTQPNSVPKDTRIVVNAPAYRMDVFQDGKLLKTYRVGIGYPEFPLPVGMRRAASIIFNPTWTPPDEPWVKGKFAPGKTVEAGSKDNPLGPIKIPIGLPNLIHGGKQPAKLGGFASHGCVGLTNDGIQDFATTLASIAGASSVTPDAVKNYGTERGQTKDEKLPKAIPVELRYETIVAENGGLHVYRDVYERGTNTVADANKVLQVYGLSYDALPAPEKAAVLQALTEMNRDPQGNAIVENIGGGAAPDSSAQSNTDPTKSAKAKSGGETKTIKGRKDVLVPIAALAGKGYPAPVNVVGAPAATDTATTARR